MALMKLTLIVMTQTKNLSQLVLKGLSCMKASLAMTHSTNAMKHFGEYD